MKVQANQRTVTRTPPIVSFLYVMPWGHEFQDYGQSKVPGHRLFYAAELAGLGLTTRYYERKPSTKGRLGLLRWRIEQAFWAARNSSSAIVATHEAAAYAFLLLKRLGLSRKSVVVLTVAAAHNAGKSSLAARLKRWLLNRAECLTVYETAHVSRLEQTFERPRVVFLPLGIDDDFFVRDDTRERGKFYLSVGTNEGKDYPTLVQALPPGVELRVVTDKQNIVMAEQWVGTKSISFFSDVPITQLRELYRSCKAMVIPIKDVGMSSGQTVLLENLALGTPVIVSDVSSVRDYVTAGEVCLVPEGSVKGMTRAIAKIEDGVLPSGQVPFRYSSKRTAEALYAVIVFLTEGKK